MKRSVIRVVASRSPGLRLPSGSIRADYDTLTFGMAVLAPPLQKIDGQ